MAIVLGTVFIASIIGSLHCVGMCGPFALLAGCNTTKRTIAPTAAYSVGRLITYSLVGLLFGAFGSAINQLGSLMTLQQTATYLAGGLMILVGSIALARAMGMRLQWLQRLSPTTFLTKFLGKQHRKAVEYSPMRRGLTIGAFSSLMPCGWLYTFAIVAAGTGSPISGMLVMAAFWAGTVPIMVALVFGVQKFGTGFRSSMTTLMGPLVILIGVFTIAFRAPIVLPADEAVVSDAPLVQQVESIDQESLPCCQ